MERTRLSHTAKFAKYQEYEQMEKDSTEEDRKCFAQKPFILIAEQERQRKLKKK